MSSVPDPDGLDAPEQTVLLIANYDDTWRHVAPQLVGMSVKLGWDVPGLDAGFAVVGHGEGGRKAQLLALDGGAGALVLISSEILTQREADLAALNMPVFLLWGEDDDVHPVENAYRLDTMLTNSTLTLIPECGHMLPEQAPDQVGALLLEWLRQHWLRLAPGERGGANRGGLEGGPAADAVIMDLTSPEEP
jgi:hypothetical protein